MRNIQGSLKALCHFGYLLNIVTMTGGTESQRGYVKCGNIFAGKRKMWDLNL